MRWQALEEPEKKPPVLKGLWSYLLDPDHRGRLAFVVAPIVFLLGYFNLNPSPSMHIPATCKNFAGAFEDRGDVINNVVVALERIRADLSQISVPYFGGGREIRNEISRREVPVADCARALVDQGSLPSKERSQLAAFVSMHYLNSDFTTKLAEDYGKIAYEADRHNPWALFAFAAGRFANTSSELNERNPSPDEGYALYSIAARDAANLLDDAIEIERSNIIYELAISLSGVAAGKAFHHCRRGDYNYWNDRALFLMDLAIENDVSPIGGRTWEDAIEHREGQMVENVSCQNW